MKTLCIYHSRDLDGWMSAAIVQYWWEKQPQNVGGIIGEVLTSEKGHLNLQNTIGVNISDQLHFLGWDYGDVLPIIEDYDEVIMCDIAFPIENMLKLHDKFGEAFIWIDHHKSSIDQMLKTQVIHQGFQNVNYAACELTWKYFFLSQPIPELVRRLGRYDCFGHKGTSEERMILEFQYGARECISNRKDAYEWLEECIDEPFGNVELDIERKGRAIYSYICTEAKSIFKSGFDIEIHDGEKVLKGRAFNKERFNPMNFKINSTVSYDVYICFWYTNGIWNFSVYSDKSDVDCSIIAKSQGGGGHKGAAGFINKHIEWFVNLKYFVV